MQAFFLTNGYTSNFKKDFRPFLWGSFKALLIPYIAFALLIYAGLDGIKRKLPLKGGLDQNLYLLTPEELRGWDTIPKSLLEAKNEAIRSSFLKTIIPEDVINFYLR